MNKKLQPCPFCGETKRLNSEASYVECENCGAFGPSLDPGVATAIEQWNRRTPRRTAGRKRGE